MAHAIVIKNYGGSEVLTLDSIEINDPGPGQIRITQSAAGVNFHDVYVRSGLYKTLALPGIPGCEAVGRVIAVGGGVQGISEGDRVAYVTGTYGAYASERILDARLALKIPDGVSDDVVATNLLRAMTVDMLVARVAELKAGDTILVQAAAGGVGKLLCQWASSMGVTVIGTVGSAEKAERAKAAGCTHPVLYRDVDFVEAVNDLTKGAGVDVVYDSVGADTFDGSLDILKPTGHLVNFGQSSGPVAPLEMPRLAAKSLTVSRPILFHYIADEVLYRKSADAVFEAFATERLRVEAVHAVPLAEANRAHDILESRTGGGSIILTN